MAGYGTLSVRSTGDAGDDRRPGAVLLHGFTQTAGSWGPVVEALAGRFRLLLPDAPGHGGSSHVRADLWATSDLLAQAWSSRSPAGGQTAAVWGGYSMGGRMALHVALAHPEVVSRLVLISTTAGIEDEPERRARRQADLALADRVEADGVAAFLAWWLDQPLFATLPAAAARVDERRANTAEGLASSLRLAGVGSQEPLWARLAELRQRALPVLLVAGEKDAAYRRHAERIAESVGPSAQLHVIARAGHACHLEQPGAVAAAIASFCSSAG